MEDFLPTFQDAMVYNSELTSDPFMGKTKSGGSIASMNLPNPNIFLDRVMVLQAKRVDL
jgi:hypothetical protein